VSTRAVFTFRDETKASQRNATDIHVYKHNDGYPSEAVKSIANARTCAWPLPRFEADEFAAAFVAANKTAPGDIRLSAAVDARQTSADAEYHYVTTMKDDVIHVTIYTCDWWTNIPSEKEIFTGTLVDAIAKFDHQVLGLPTIEVSLSEISKGLPTIEVSLSEISK
jgi:hypothetical protein